MKKHLALALPFFAAACSTPAPQLPKIAAPVPVITPNDTELLDWRDKPYTPGLWRYANRTASFGPAGIAPLLTMQCDAARRLIVISVSGATSSLTIRTSYAERSWPAQIGTDGRSVVSFAPADPALDQIAFSRGRFSISGPGLTEIDIPAWAEPARVVEDCRS
ncbi:hypothetical protein [Sphingomonas crusticola]|uniref:hypothetical protein n=1 Tax=Sphingomonas crusticola TaxID=1697973 RepID=UPI000E2865CC|nr:hypothetical protein [Sphingomonas crusticola]